MLSLVVKLTSQFKVKERQSLQQKIRTLENTIDTGSRNSNEKDSKISELENQLAKEKTENERLEKERSDLVAKVDFTLNFLRYYCAYLHLEIRF